jgi:predicted DNA-binding transcriptional regulator AlpA
MRRYSAPSPLYPTPVAAKVLNMSVSTIRNKAKQDSSFPQPVRNNGKILGWIPDQLDAWIKQH